ncbi:MAG: hypothetical protein HON65_09220 [Rhodospirillales bacterium]|jgi:hypothetical protein|nr:hypothetical protein [Rhodospirillales bacterium]
MRPDTETLNAYVDGELDKENASKVARAVADDPVLARKVAILTDLSSSLAESIDTPDLQIEDLVPTVDNSKIKRGSRHGFGKLMAIAACLAGLLIIGPLIYRDMVVQGDPESWTVSVLAEHNFWNIQDAKSKTPTIHLSEFLSGELSKLVYVPDLSSARLKMVYVNPLNLETGAEHFVVGYAGTRGCKITMVAQAAMGILDEKARNIPDPKLHVIAWNAGPLDYILMSQGMDKDRFELIAKTVRQSSLNHQPVNSETRVALGISRETSVPCAV